MTETTPAEKLIRACIQGDLAQVKRLIEQGRASASIVDGKAVLD